MLFRSVLATGFTWTFFPPAYAPAAAVVVAAAWSLLILVLFSLNRREQGRALKAVRTEASRWGGARVDALIDRRALLELERIARAAGRALEEVGEEAACLEEALSILDREAAVPHLPPAVTAVSVPVDGHLTVAWREGAPERLGGAAPAEMVRRLLERAGPAAEGGAAPLQAAMEADSRSVPLLMPIRAIEPAEGEPLHVRQIVLAGGDPFLLLRCVVTRPFGLPGSARLDPTLAGRDDR